jgi:L-ascorbate metabolism protein UlaG (beta-lactamase superfamily)
LLQTKLNSILIDPLTAWDNTDPQATLTFRDLPDHIDYVVFSQCHMDHFCPEMILQLRKRVGTFIVPRNNEGDIADPSMRLMLHALGCHNVKSVEPFEAIATPDGEIVSLPFPGEHCGLGIYSKHSIVVRIAGRSFLFLVDSDAIDTGLYVKIGQRIGPVDAAFIGMECQGSPLSWFYGPLLSQPISRKDDESRRGNASNCARAWSALQQIVCPRIYVYAMGSEPWNRYLLGLAYSSDSVQITQSDELVERCRNAGRQAQRLHGCSEMFF